MLVLFYFQKFVYSTFLTLTESKNVTSKNVPLKNTSDCPLKLSFVVLSFVYRKVHHETSEGKNGKSGLLE